MSRDEVSRILHRMEQLREEADEAESDAQEKALTAEYGRLWQIVKPHLPK